MRRPHRVVVLTGDGALHRHTCAVLIRAGVHLVGVVVCSRSGVAARARFAVAWGSRHGWLTLASQVLGRLYDRVRNAAQDRMVLRRLVDEEADRAVIRASRVPLAHTDSYSRTDTKQWIAGLDPDLLLVHTKYVVGRSVRALAKVAVIGGHPGITPEYRGAYSPFWAIHRGDPGMVGCTVFLLDDGMDTGPVLFQGRPAVEPGIDSHLTLAWKGMMIQAREQAAVIQRLDRGETVTVRPILQVPPHSYYGPPTLLDFMRYRRRQSQFR